jgi:hypothetical protein
MKFSEYPPRIFLNNDFPTNIFDKIVKNRFLAKRSREAAQQKRQFMLALQSKSNILGKARNLPLTADVRLTQRFLSLPKHLL